LQQVLSQAQLGHTLDWPAPTKTPALTAQLQEPLADRTDPQAFATALEADNAASSQR
jgi:hypothetical protein